jgi:hypothetical protein
MIVQASADVSAFEQWFGGPAFSYSLSCSGQEVGPVDNQSIAPVCPD